MFTVTLINRSFYYSILTTFRYKNNLVLFIIFIMIELNSCKEEESKTKSISIKGMVLIPKGILEMGGDNDQADANEFPKHKVAIDSFLLDEAEVTNAQFKTFVNVTGYVTIAERPLNWEELKKQLPPDTPKPADSLLQPGALVFHSTETPVPLDNPGLWWTWTLGANWQHPHHT